MVPVWPHMGGFILCKIPSPYSSQASSFAVTTVSRWAWVAGESKVPVGRPDPDQHAGDPGGGQHGIAHTLPFCDDLVIQVGVTGFALFLAGVYRNKKASLKSV